VRREEKGWGRKAAGGEESDRQGGEWRVERTGESLG